MSVEYIRSRMALELPSPYRATGLVDVLDRVLDKGLVIAGDIKVPPAALWVATSRYHRWRRREELQNGS